MRQKSGPAREPAEQVVKDIRRATDHPPGRAIASAGQSARWQSSAFPGRPSIVGTTCYWHGGPQALDDRSPGRIGSGTASRMLSVSGSGCWRWTS